jgi:galactokinase
MPGFREVFGFEPEVTARAAGRVNILGEHTDYNEGFVLPTVIPQTTCVEIARSPDNWFHLHSGNMQSLARSGPARIDYRDGEDAPPGYGRYVDGCVRLLRERGIAVPPLLVAVRSTVPIGVGLSSSAALEVAVLRALRELLAVALDDVELARAAQQAEIRYAGVRCGIMDQAASSLGDPAHMLFLDTRTLQWRLLAFPPGTQIVVIDSGVPRSLAAAPYNERRSECEAAARTLGVAALRDVTDPARASSLPAPLDRRARHVITENNRVLQAAAGANAATLGSLMHQSHLSLRDDFAVSVPALDALVDCLQQHPSVFGSRLTGAGFGGACVALVEAGAATDVKERTLREFAQRGYRGTALI